MKLVLVVTCALALFCTSCKSYLEYTGKTKELSYSTNLKKVKRYSSLEKALEKPLEVEFLDLHLYKIERKQEALNALNENISQFKNLKKLVISNTTDANLIFLMNILKHQPLEFLVIQSWVGLKPDFFQNLPHLKNLIFLGLPHCKIDKFPHTIFALEKLEGLDISANCIEQIPVEIGQLQNLKTIDLTNNQLNRFPSELSACLKLEFLDINNAEGNNTAILNSYGFCVNKITDFSALKNFKSIKEVSVFKLVDSYTLKVLKVEYPHIKF